MPSNKQQPFQCNNGHYSTQRRRLAARVEQGNCSNFTSRFWTTAGSTPSRSGRWSRCRTSTSSSTRRGARFFTTLDVAMAYMQFRIREEDQYRRRSSSPAASTSSAPAPSSSACTVCHGQCCQWCDSCIRSLAAQSCLSTQQGAPCPSPARLAQALCWAALCRSTATTSESSSPSPRLERSIWCTCGWCSRR